MGNHALPVCTGALVAMQAGMAAPSLACNRVRLLRVSTVPSRSCVP